MVARTELDTWESSQSKGRHLASSEVAEILDAQFKTGAKPAIAAPAKDKFILNVRPDPIDFRDRIYEPGLTQLETIMPPPDLAGQNISVRNQGSEGSCTGQALAVVIDLQNIARRNAGADVPERVSARMLFEHAKQFDEYVEDKLPGSSARGAIKAFFHQGVCSTDAAPYVEGDKTYKLTREIAKDAKKVTLGAYFRLRHILNDYHAALNEAQAIFCTAMIHPGWDFAPVIRAGGRIVLPETGVADVKSLGGHAFAIVGYDTKGFLVLSSWGGIWGGFDLHDMVPKPKDPPLEPKPQKQIGIAHWSYEDWSAHVLDAWVLRLQAPTGKPSGFAGGYHTVGRQEKQSGFGLRQPSEPNLKVLGHYIHIKNGKLCDEPPYHTDNHSIDETIRHLLETCNGPKRKYDHVAFYAHGGLNSLDAAIARTAAMVEGFKRNRIWPIFYIWRTGLGDIAGDLVDHILARILERSAGFQDLSDTLIETASRTIARPFWNEMKADAALSTQDNGSAWATTAKIIVDVNSNIQQKPMSFHFIGHSAGAILLGHLFDRAMKNLNVMNSIKTVSLFAPACDLDRFAKSHLPMAQKLGAGENFAVYNLPDAVEQADNVAKAYRKSLLYLVSNALEKDRGHRIAGLDAHFKKEWKSKLAYYLAGEKKPGSQTSSHGGFDNDPSIMNDVLDRICRDDKLAKARFPFNSAELSSNLF